jgi:Uma2 family endonuclease
VQHRLGAVLDSSTGFWMHNRNCRAPDVSFVSRERLERLGFKPSTRKFFPGAPDLAIEILSRNNTRAEIDCRLKDFFESGTQIAWIVNSDLEAVEILPFAADAQTSRRGRGFGWRATASRFQLSHCQPVQRVGLGLKLDRVATSLL